MKKSRLILIILLIFSALGTYVYYETSIQAEENRNKILKQSYAERIKIAVLSVSHPINGLTRTSLNEKGELSLNKFNTFAEILFDPQNHRAITYAPDGITKYVYPFSEQNKQIIGHNLLTSPYTSMEAKKAVNSESITISGPYALMQVNEYGIVIRNPIFKGEGENRKFWGFISLVLKSPNFLLATGLTNIENLGYEFSLLGNHKSESVPILHSANFNSEKSSYYEFDVFNANWKFSIYRPEKSIQIIQHSFWLFSLFIVISLALYKIIDFLEIRNKIYKEQLVTDKLTGAYTRTYLSDYQFSDEFCLFYLDLNKFKPVNDTYGHEVGDKLLINYVKRLKERLKKDTPIVRLGGDEFLVVVNQKISQTGIEQIKQRIKNLTEEIFMIDSHEIQLGVSIGYSICPEHGTELAALINHADKIMYSEKRSR